MIDEQRLKNKFSIGISFYKMKSNDWLKILYKYKPYINDIFFSPVESLEYQTRRNVYNYDTQSIAFLESELDTVLYAAKRLGLTLKMVLNTPQFIDNPEKLIVAYKNYKCRYEIEYITTFQSCARRIKEIDNTQKIICSYNQGIKSYNELKDILDTQLFCTIVLGTRFLRDFNAFRLIHNYGQKIELLLNNGCMSNCESFCKFPNNYCITNFSKNLTQKSIDLIYAECSIFPEELHKYYLSNNIVDYFKLSTRPIHFEEMCNMLSSYIEGNSMKYINSNIYNYHLYSRLAHFGKYYKILDYNQILHEKETIWNHLITK